MIRRRYEALSIVNDILIGLWFTVGSILFFFEPTATTSTWFLVIGSVELLIRPISMTRIVHLGRRPAGVGDRGGEGTAGEFDPGLLKRNGRPRWSQGRRKIVRTGDRGSHRATG